MMIGNRKIMELELSLEELDYIQWVTPPILVLRLSVSIAKALNAEDTSFVVVIASNSGG